MGDPMKIRAAVHGGVTEVKVLMQHPMETGFRKDEAGKPIAREIINSFVCTLNGHEVFRADLEPAISANPYFEFTVKVEDSGTFAFAWVDDNGTVTTAEQGITVS